MISIRYQTGLSSGLSSGVIQLKVSAKKMLQVGTFAPANHHSAPCLARNFFLSLN
jgi:hypothetical protein